MPTPCPVAAAETFLFLLLCGSAFSARDIFIADTYSRLLRNISEIECILPPEAGNRFSELDLYSAYGKYTELVQLAYFVALHIVLALLDILCVEDVLD